MSYDERLVDAAFNYNLALVKDSLANGVDVNAYNNDGETPLYCAVDNGQTEIEKMLRDAGAIK